MAATRKVGVPIRLMQEAETHSVTVELKSGETYRGTLHSCEPNMNCSLEDALHTAKDGRVTKLEHVYLRGSNVKFIVVPDILANAPMFTKISQMGAKALGSSGKNNSKKKKLNIYKSRR